MKRENLYFVGGALLASTALTTAASAATYTLNSGTLSNAVVSTTALRMSTQAFPATPATTDQLGPVGLITRLSGPLASTFTATINVTGAKFASGTVTANDVVPIQFSTFSGSGTATLAATTFNSSTHSVTMGCAVAFSADTLVLASCNPVSTSFGSVGGFSISGVGFDNATGLTASGTSISLSGTITIGGVTLDNTPAQAVVTSANAVAAVASSINAITSMNVAATPAFANLGSATALSVQIAAGTVTTSGALARDLRTSLSNLGLVIGATNSLQVNSTVFSDDALARTELLRSNATTLTAAPTVFSGGFVTFGNLAAADLQSFSVNVVFNGTAAIDNASAGTYALTFSTAGSANSVNSSTPPALAGTTAALTRGGLNIDINSIQPSVAQGARVYTSLLRVVNTSSNAAGTVSIVLRNNDSGVVLGTYTSPSIPAGGSAQITAAQLEAGAGITPTATVLYKASISGAIQGYVQHVNWNQDAGFFSDLSGRRNSTNGTNN